MIYVFENDSNNASVVFDGATLTPEQKAKGVAVEALPIPETPEGKVATLKCRKSTGEVWYEYADRPTSPEEELQQRVLDLEIAMAEIMGVM